MTCRGEKTMKKLLLALALFLTACEGSNLDSMNSYYRAQCWSGGKLVYDETIRWDGWEKRDLDGNLVSIPEMCVLTEIKD